MRGMYGPHALVAVVTAVLALLVAIPSATAARSDLAPESTCSSGQGHVGQVKEMLCLVNWARTHNGLAPLRAQPRLQQAARLKLADNVRCGEFSHTACGRSFTAVFGQAQYRGRTIGENLAWGQGRLSSPRQIMAAWLGSDGHRANILSPQFTELGMSVRVAGTFMGMSGVTLWAQAFGRR